MPQNSITVPLSPQQYEALQDLATKQGIDTSDAISQALAVTKLVVDADNAKDTRVLIETGDKLQELTFKGE